MKGEGGGGTGWSKDEEGVWENSHLHSNINFHVKSELPSVGFSLVIMAGEAEKTERVRGFKEEWGGGQESSKRREKWMVIMNVVEEEKEFYVIRRRVILKKSDKNYS